MALYRSEKEFLQSFRRFNALSSHKHSWHTGVSEKTHACEFGHDIQPEELYFKKPLDLEGEQKLRVCKNCMEKLVYVTVDSDTHARGLSEQLYRQANPPTQKVLDMMLH